MKHLKHVPFESKKSAGYTLIELLAVISILVVTSSIMGGILYSTLRGASKTRITTDVSQSGSYALSVIKSIIADSRNVTEIDGASIADCTTSPSGTSSITFRRLDGNTSVIACSQNIISSNSASLVNSERVNVSNCSFSCSQLVDDPYSIPVVNVSLTVSDKGGGFFESKSSSVFNVSTSLRTFAP